MYTLLYKIKKKKKKKKIGLGRFSWRIPKCAISPWQTWWFLICPINDPKNKIIISMTQSNWKRTKHQPTMTFDYPSHIIISYSHEQSYSVRLFVHIIISYYITNMIVLLSLKNMNVFFFFCINAKKQRIKLGQTTYKKKN